MSVLPFPKRGHATTWIIHPDGSGDAPTIQAGVDSAVAGDTVLVTAGTYPHIQQDDTGDYSVVQMKSGVVLLSSDGPEQTILNVDTTLVTRGVTLIDCDSGTVVEGFTIIRGDAFSGAGIYVLGGSPRIRENILFDAYGGTGGAMAIIGGAEPVVSDNLFDQNVACCGVGGAILIDGASPEIRGNTFFANSGFGGGAVAFLNSSGIVSNNDFISNTGTNGGALLLQNSEVEVRDNRFTGNHATTEGGAVAFAASVGTRFINNIVAGNVADGDGGGLIIEDSSPEIIQTTIAGNSAINGGGIYCTDNSTVTVLNSILWGDNAYTDKEVYVSGSSSITISYSDIEGSWSGKGNIDGSPSFLLPERRDYRLLWGSPCIDSGHPDSTDQDGSRSDMGAHFFDQSKPVTIYLTPDTTAVTGMGELGVTYTLINIDTEPWTFHLRSDVTLPNGNPYPGNPLVGPVKVTLPGERAIQRHVTHPVAGQSIPGTYTYKSIIGQLPGQLIDKDRFYFTINEP
jgi:predicted outer membrane repeat protein